MKKLIHSEFELDLSNFKIATTEENNWFSDSFFAKYTFPFQIDLKTDLDVAFGFISQYNANGLETYFDLKYLHDNVIEPAILEVDSYQEKINCTLRYGFETLSSFEKKLSEISLEKIYLPPSTNIYDYAQSVITQTYPAVNFNFPQIHVDKYDPEEDIYNGFKKILNNREAGVFLENYVDSVTETTYNFNIMQPLPYWLHILERGFLDSGYTLSGDILNDNLLKEATLFGDVDYFKKTDNSILDPISIYKMSNDATTNILVNYGRDPFLESTYNVDITLPATGKYNITGKINLREKRGSKNEIFIYYKNNLLYKYDKKPITNKHNWARKRTLEIDLIFETTGVVNPNDVTIKVVDLYSTDEIIIELDILLVYLTNNSSNTPLPTIVNDNIIDLTKSVPDITFIDFIKIIKNWFNYDLDIIGNQAIMNKIESKINYTNAIDFQFSEVKNPIQKFSTGNSFLLKFSDIDNPDYKYLPIFHSNKDITSSSYTTNEKTTTIEINALPLPIKSINDIQTAHALEQNENKIFLVRYAGLYNNNNLAWPIENYLIPAVHASNWEKWFDFRIQSRNFSWNFKAWEEQLIELTTKSKLFAYNKYHIIKTINKTEEIPGLYSVDIETETLE